MTGWLSLIARRVSPENNPATRDADATPELTRIGYQPRRDPGDVNHPTIPLPGTASSSSSTSSSSSGSSIGSSSSAST